LGQRRFEADECPCSSCAVVPELDIAETFGDNEWLEPDDWISGMRSASLQSKLKTSIGNISLLNRPTEQVRE
jgi:hypothetical protein